MKGFVQTVAVCFAMLASLNGCGDGRPARPTGKPDDPAAQTSAPALASAEGGPITISRPRKAIVVYDLAQGVTRILYRPHAARLALDGRRLAWSEGTEIHYCDLPDGKIASIKNDTVGAPVGVFGDTLVFRTKSGVRLHDIGSRTTRDVAVRGGWFYLSGERLIVADDAAGQPVRLAHPATGEVAALPLRETTGSGLAFRGGVFAVAQRQRAGADGWAYSMHLHDVASGETRTFETPDLLAWARFAGGEILGFTQTRLGVTPVYRFDPATGSSQKLFDCDAFSALHGFDSNGRQVVWGHHRALPQEEGGGTVSSVWMWDAADGQLVEISALARAQMPELVMAAGEPPGSLDDKGAVPSFKRDLGARSVCIGEGYVAWIEEWGITWSVKARAGGSKGK